MLSPNIWGKYLTKLSNRHWPTTPAIHSWPFSRLLSHRLFSALNFQIPDFQPCPRDRFPWKKYWRILLLKKKTCPGDDIEVITWQLCFYGTKLAPWNAVSLRRSKWTNIGLRLHFDCKIHLGLLLLPFKCSYGICWSETQFVSAFTLLNLTKVKSQTSVRFSLTCSLIHTSSMSLIQLWGKNCNHVRSLAHPYKSQN